MKICVLGFLINESFTGQPSSVTFPRLSSKPVCLLGGRVQCLLCPDISVCPLVCLHPSPFSWLECLFFLFLSSPLS